MGGGGVEPGLDRELLQRNRIGVLGEHVEQLVAETAKTLGAPIAVKGFTRLALGEGVEKKQDDFAAEVASMTGQA